MSDLQAPLAQVRLMDGRELVITPDAARVGDRVSPIARIEEARLLFLRPETIGLRMADVGLLEYTVAQPGDGQRALDAIYSVRPELRRADLEPPAPEAPAGFQVPTAPAPAPTPDTPIAAWDYSPNAGPYQPGAYPQTPQGRYPAGAYPRAGYPYPAPMRPPVQAPPFPQSVIDAYGPQPNERYATLTPQPRSAPQLIGATFRLIARRFNLFALVSLLIVFLPNLVLGALSLVVLAISGQDPFGASPSLTSQFQQAMSAQTANTTAAATQGDALGGLLSIIILAATLMFTGWSVAALTVAAREVALGRPVSARACLSEGRQRLGATLWALIATNVLLIIVAFPALVFVVGGYLAVQPEPGQPPLPAGSVPGVITMAVIASALTLALLVWLWPRLALAPTAAALGFSAPIRTGWLLARGGARRIFFALLVVGILTTALTGAATWTQFFSNGWSALVFVPIAQLIASPLSALIHTLTLYDQRLRNEGYALFQRESVTPPTSTAESQGAVESK